MINVINYDWKDSVKFYVYIYVFFGLIFITYINTYTTLALK